MRTLTAQDKFNAALAKAKDQFTALVDGGTLNNLADLIVDITNRLNRLFGNEIRSNENRLRSIEERAEQAEKQYDVKRTPEYNVLKDEVAQLQSDAALAKARSRVAGTMSPIVGLYNSVRSLKKSGEAAELVSGMEDLITDLETEGVKRKTETLDDFIIRPGQPTQKFDKGDLVIGGTNLMGGGSNKRIESLLEKLVGAVESGGNVFIDGNKAGRAMVLGSHKLS